MNIKQTFVAIFLLITTTYSLLKPCSNETYSKICWKTETILKKNPGPPYLPSTTFVTPKLEIREILEANEEKHTGMY